MDSYAIAPYPCSFWVEGRGNSMGLIHEARSQCGRFQSCLRLGCLTFCPLDEKISLEGPRSDGTGGHRGNACSGDDTQH